MLAAIVMNKNAIYESLLHVRGSKNIISNPDSNLQGNYCLSPPQR